MSLQGCFGDSQPGRRQALALGKLAREPGQHLPGIVGLTHSQVRRHQVRHGKLGHVAARIGGQISFEGSDGVCITAGVQVRLADQEPGIGRHRPGVLLSKLGKDRVGFGRPAEGAVGQGQVVPCGLSQGRRQCRCRDHGFLAGGIRLARPRRAAGFRLFGAGPHERFEYRDGLLRLAR